jgi:fructokinase
MHIHYATSREAALGNTARVVSVGEILWDVFPDGERLGGAALNFSVNLARLGDQVSLITGVGDDQRGRAAKESMASFGLTTDFVQLAEGYETGIAWVNSSPDGEPCFDIPRPAAFDAVDITADLIERAKRLKPDWLYFGTLLQSQPHVEEGVARLRWALPGTSCFYDMNLRTGSWSLPLVDRLCRLAKVLKLNAVEAETLSCIHGLSRDSFTLENFSVRCAETYDISTICITLGEKGCFVYDRESIHVVPGYPVQVRDSVGAGDAFAAAFLHGYHLGWPITRTARFANAAGSIVASRAGATPPWSMQECLSISSMDEGFPQFAADESEIAR